RKSDERVNRPAIASTAFGLAGSSGVNSSAYASALPGRQRAVVPGLVWIGPTIVLSSPRCQVSIGAVQESLASGWQVVRNTLRGTGGYSNARARPSGHGPAAGGFAFHARDAPRPTS